MNQYVIWVAGPDKKPNVSLKTALALAHAIQHALNENQEVLIKYVGPQEHPLQSSVPPLDYSDPTDSF